MEKISLRFLGAARTVTGSKFLVQAGNKHILIDCGLFQGLKPLRLLNWEPFPFDPKKIDLVLLTHGHLDHTGYLPRLVKEGFNGKIWGTAPTLELAKLILRDSARIQEEDAEEANRENYSTHQPALPLYTLRDVNNTVPLMVSQGLDQWIPIEKNIYCRFNYNGHILGATFIELRIGEKILVFSGDIGRINEPLLFAPQQPAQADILLIESTYGDQLHPANAEEKLAEVVNRTLAENGTLIVPGFAVERSQLLVYLLHQLRKKGHIPQVPIYFDSPMGTDAMEIFTRYTAWHKLSANECREISNEIAIIHSLKDTYRVADSRGSKIIVAGSGMATGGRVLAYLARYVGDPSATILLTGFQAEGTRGRALLEGATQIKLFGKYFPVKARIEKLEGISAHADQYELLDWLKKLKKAPEKIFIVHGEEKSAEALQKKIKEKYGYPSEIPYLNQEYTITT